MQCQGRHQLGISSCGREVRVDGLHLRYHGASIHVHTGRTIDTADSLWGRFASSFHVPCRVHIQEAPDVGDFAVDAGACLAGERLERVDGDG